MLHDFAQHFKRFQRQNQSELTTTGNRVNRQFTRHNRMQRVNNETTNRAAEIRNAIKSYLGE